MISSLLVGLVFAATCALLSFFSTCVYNEIKQTSKDDAFFLLIAVPVGTLVMTFMSFGLWAVATKYADNVPVSDLGTVGLLGVPWALGYIAAIGGAAVATGYSLLKAGKLVGRGAAAAYRWLSDRKGTRKQQALAPQAEVHSINLGAVYAQFNSVKTLCESLRNQLKEGESFTRLGTLLTELEKVRTAIDDENKKSVVPVLMADYIGPTERGLKAYERLLKRNVSTADSSMSEMQEKTLPLMLEKIQSIYGQIHVGDIAELATVASQLEVARPLKVEVEAPAEAVAHL